MGYHTFTGWNYNGDSRPCQIGKLTSEYESWQFTKRNSVDRELAPCFKKLWSRSRLSKNSAICHVKITPSNLIIETVSNSIVFAILNNSIDTWSAYPLNSFTMGVCKFSAICISSSLPHKAHKTILKFKQSNLNWFYSAYRH